jgi:AraC-like DNA-binding protein
MNSPYPHEHSKFWIDPQLDNLELLRATYITYAFAPHIHETFAIGVTEVGAQEYTYNRRQRLIMPAGSVAVVHPGEVHTSQAVDSSGWSYRMLYPSADLLKRAASEVSGRWQGQPCFSSPVIFDPDLARRIHALHVALEDPATLTLERESRLLWTLSLLVYRHADRRLGAGPARADPAVVRKARQLLEERFAENITLDQLAAYVNMSAFHLLRVFRDTVGLPPHAYLLQVRVARGKRLLQAGWRLADVAAQTGFVDQSHFSKHFKRVMGVSPGQYRPR